jgi:hypothetical protein
MSFFKRLTRLVRKRLPELIVLLKLINEVIALVNKAVNYDRKFPQFRVFLQ